MHDKFAKCTQHQKRKEAAKRINKHQRRTGLRQPSTGAQEQPGANCATNRDHLDLTRFKCLVVSEVFFREDLAFGRCRFYRFH